MVKAARIIIEDRIAEVTLLGDEKNIEKLASENGLDLSKAKVKNPEKSSEFVEYAQEYFKIREKKGMTMDRAKEFIKNPLFFGAMMVRKGEVDCSVAGSINTTGDVLRAALHIIGLAPGIKAVSSSFLIVVPEFLGQKDKVFVFGDCAVIPDPDPEQLASIAVSSARTMKSLVGEEPKVAMLSFSTKGSARHQLVDKVIQGTRIAKEISPEIEIDGELQFDSAVIPEVARKKSPGSKVAGQANVLIFPDLNSGNIGYKLAQRLSRASAVGPIIQGLAKPANDLSRGCSVDDIVNVVAVASLLA